MMRSMVASLFLLFLTSLINLRTVCASSSSSSTSTSSLVTLTSKPIVTPKLVSTLLLYPGSTTTLTASSAPYSSILVQSHSSNATYAISPWGSDFTISLFATSQTQNDQYLIDVTSNDPRVLIHQFTDDEPGIMIRGESKSDGSGKQKGKKRAKETTNKQVVAVNPAQQRRVTIPAGGLILRGLNSSRTPQRQFLLNVTLLGNPYDWRVVNLSLARQRDLDQLNYMRGLNVSLTHEWSSIRTQPFIAQRAIYLALYDVSRSVAIWNNLVSQKRHILRVNITAHFNVSGESILTLPPITLHRPVITAFVDQSPLVNFGTQSIATKTSAPTASNAVVSTATTSGSSSKKKRTTSTPTPLHYRWIPVRNPSPHHSLDVFMMRPIPLPSNRMMIYESQDDLDVIDEVEWSSIEVGGRLESDFFEEQRISDKNNSSLLFDVHPSFPFTLASGEDNFVDRLTLGPGMSGTLGPISFKPTSHGNFSSLVVLFNNLTRISFVRLRGKGGAGRVAFLPYHHPTGGTNTAGKKPVRIPWIPARRSMRHSQHVINSVTARASNTTLTELTLNYARRFMASAIMQTKSISELRDGFNRPITTKYAHYNESLLFDVLNHGEFDLVLRQFLIVNDANATHSFDACNDTMSGSGVNIHGCDVLPLTISPGVSYTFRISYLPNFHASALIPAKEMTLQIRHSWGQATIPIRLTLPDILEHHFYSSTHDDAQTSGSRLVFLTIAASLLLSVGLFFSPTLSNQLRVLRSSALLASKSLTLPPSTSDLTGDDASDATSHLSSSHKKKGKKGKRRGSHLKSNNNNGNHSDVYSPQPDQHDSVDQSTVSATEGEDDGEFTETDTNGESSVAASALASDTGMDSSYPGGSTETSDIEGNRHVRFAPSESMLRKIARKQAKKLDKKKAIHLTQTLDSLHQISDLTPEAAQILDQLYKPTPSPPTNDAPPQASPDSVSGAQDVWPVNANPIVEEKRKKTMIITATLTAEAAQPIWKDISSTPSPPAIVVGVGSIETTSVESSSNDSSSASTPTNHDQPKTKPPIVPHKHGKQSSNAPVTLRTTTTTTTTVTSPPRQRPLTVSTQQKKESSAGSTPRKDNNGNNTKDEAHSAHESTPTIQRKDSSGSNRWNEVVSASLRKSSVDSAPPPSIVAAAVAGGVGVTTAAPPASLVLSNSNTPTISSLPIDIPVVELPALSPSIFADFFQGDNRPLTTRVPSVGVIGAIGVRTTTATSGMSVGASSSSSLNVSASGDSPSHADVTGTGANILLPSSDPVFQTREPSSKRREMNEEDDFILQAGSSLLFSDVRRTSFTLPLAGGAMTPSGGSGSAQWNEEDLALLNGGSSQTEYDEIMAEYEAYRRSPIHEESGFTHIVDTHSPILLPTTSSLINPSLIQLRDGGLPPSAIVVGPSASPPNGLAHPRPPMHLTTGRHMRGNSGHQQHHQHQHQHPGVVTSQQQQQQHWSTYANSSPQPPPIHASTSGSYLSPYAANSSPSHRPSGGVGASHSNPTSESQSPSRISPSHSISPGSATMFTGVFPTQHVSHIGIVGGAGGGSSSGPNSALHTPAHQSPTVSPPLRGQDAPNANYASHMNRMNQHQQQQQQHGSNYHQSPLHQRRAVAGQQQQQQQSHQAASIFTPAMNPNQHYQPLSTAQQISSLSPAQVAQLQSLLASAQAQVAASGGVGVGVVGGSGGSNPINWSDAIGSAILSPPLPGNTLLPTPSYSGAPLPSNVLLSDPQSGANVTSGTAASSVRSQPIHGPQSSQQQQQQQMSVPQIQHAQLNHLSYLLTQAAQQQQQQQQHQHGRHHRNP